jgi:DNA-binding protein H-NS
MALTLEQIRRKGLAALRRELGQEGMIRFLQQFETGSGDYARERHAWADQTSLDDIRRAASARRTKKKQSLLLEPNHETWSGRGER